VEKVGPITSNDRLLFGYFRGHKNIGKAVESEYIFNKLVSQENNFVHDSNKTTDKSFSELPLVNYAMLLEILVVSLPSSEAFGYLRSSELFYVVAKESILRNAFPFYNSSLDLSPP
jgi:hypothetical protein